jgi:predicted Zn-dependent protease
MKKAKALSAIFFITQTFFLYGQGFPGAQGGNDPFSVLDNAISDSEKTLTPEEEYYLGRAVAANILTVYMPYTQNQALTAYLNNICQALAINSPIESTVYNNYQVTILDSREFNGFATPGGHIFVTKGLIEAVPSEDALAGVIAHELAHIMLKHGISMIKSMKEAEDLNATAQRSAAIAGSGNNGGRGILEFRNSISDLMDVMLKSGYSKTQEFEADNIAVVLLASAGYDIQGVPEVLKVLLKEQHSQQGGFFSTHPAPSERITNVERLTAGRVSPNTQPARRPRFNRNLGRR